MPFIMYSVETPTANSKRPIIVSIKQKFDHRVFDHGRQVGAYRNIFGTETDS